MVLYYSFFLLLIAVLFAFPQFYQMPKKLISVLWLSLFFLSALIVQNFDPETIGGHQIHSVISEYALNSISSILNSELDFAVISDICGTTAIWTKEAQPRAEIDVSLLCPNQRWLAEPFFFFPFFVFYWLGGSVTLPVVIFDTIGILALGLTFWLTNEKRIEVTQSVSAEHIRCKPNLIWLGFLFIGFFPVVVLMSFHLRQFVSVCFLLLSFALVLSDKKKISLVPFLVSVLIHNSSLIFMPLLFVLFDSRVKLFFTFIGPIFVILCIELLRSFTVVGALKANFYIGDKIGFLYVLILVCIVVFKLLLNWNEKRQLLDKFLLCSIYICLVMGVSLLFFKSGTVERLAFTSCTLMLFFSALWFEGMRPLPPVLSRICFIIIPIPALIYYF